MTTTTATTLQPLDTASRMHWTRRFKPMRFEHFCGNREAVAQARSLASLGAALPHLLVTGSVGSGKRSLIGCLRYALQPAPVKCIRITAYDDMSETLFRKHMQVLNTDVYHMNPKSYALVLIENLNHMPKAFHTVIARSLEDPELTHLKFMFTCLNLNDITPLLRSRCSEIALTKLDVDATRTLMLRVIEEMHIDIDTKARALLSFVAAGDARVLVHTLQILNYAYTRGTAINETHVMNLFDAPPPRVVTQVLGACLNGNVRQAWQWFDQRLLQHGYACSDIFNSMRQLLEDAQHMTLFQIDTQIRKKIQSLSEPTRLKALSKLYTVHRLALQGIESAVQVTGLLSALATLFAANTTTTTTMPSLSPPTTTS